MEDYRLLYELMSNPLDDEDVIKKCLKQYANDRSIYTLLIHTYVDEKQYNGKYDPFSRDELYAWLFNVWKRNVLYDTKEHVNYLLQNKIIEADYYDLRKYLMTLPDIKTEHEFREILNDENSLVAKYGWQTVGKDSSWIHVSSNALSARKLNVINIEHRLYLNTENIDTEKIALLFAKKCAEQLLPFYFKFDNYGNRDDTIVIYSDTENLGKYIEILRQIKNENSEIFFRIKKPPVLTGKIDGWIGYGSEPTILLNGKLASFNQIRAEAIEKGIKKSLNDWIFNNKNEKIKYNDRVITLKEYIAIKISLFVFQRLKDRFDVALKQRKNFEFNQSYGLTINDFESDVLKKHIYYYINLSIEEILIKRQKGQKIDDIFINTRDDKKIKVCDREIEIIIRWMIHQIVNHDTNFVNMVKKYILAESKVLEIVPEKYCFDFSGRQKIFDYCQTSKRKK